MTSTVETDYARIERNDAARGDFTLLQRMRVERGTKEDWEKLHELHYKSDGKAVGRVWRVVLDDDRLVGVAIISSPRLLIAARHELFPKLKPGRDTKVTNVYRAKFINEKFLRNSRLVVDTLYRAGGVSYRMLNLISRMEGKKYMEIQSSMSRFNPFAVKAGFRFTRPREAAAHDKGIRFMRRLLNAHPADHAGVVREIETASPKHRERLMRELREFYYKHSALERTGKFLNVEVSRVESMRPAELIRHLQQLVFGTPMYGVYVNPDVGRELPDSLPLLAFDRQATNEPLILD